MSMLHFNKANTSTQGLSDVSCQLLRRKRELQSNSYPYVSSQFISKSLYAFSLSKNQCWHQLLLAYDLIKSSGFPSSRENPPSLVVVTYHLLVYLLRTLLTCPFLWLRPYHIMFQSKDLMIRSSLVQILNLNVTKSTSLCLFLPDKRNILLCKIYKGKLYLL